MRVEKINSQQNFKGLYVKPSASKKLEYLFEKAPATLERRVECAKAIGTMQDRMKNNPVKVFVESNRKYWWGLKATVLNDSKKEVFTQDSMFNYDFLKQAVERAEQVHKINALADFLSTVDSKGKEIPESLKEIWRSK